LNHSSRTPRAYKYPRFIEFIDELPKTATGKIQRFKLRERNVSPEPASLAQKHASAAFVERLHAGRAAPQDGCLIDVALVVISRLRCWRFRENKRSPRHLR